MSKWLRRRSKHSSSRNRTNSTVRVTRVGEKSRIGKPIALLVAQAQRDLLTAQIGEVQATAAYLKSIVDLYRLEGSLLEGRGVECPGREPIQMGH